MQDLLERGNSLLAEGRVTEAIICYQGSLQEKPGHVVTLNNLANALQLAGRFAEANSIYLTLLKHAKKPLAWRIASNYLVGLQYQPEIPQEGLMSATCELGRQYGSEDAKLASSTKRADIKLKVGFVSSDLCDHPVGLYLLPFLTSLDRERFFPVLYSTGGRDDETARRLKSLASWRDAGTLDYDALLASIREDHLDILIDLSGHTAGNRLPVFARRAAPVQVSWLGYFATTGVPAMDYIIMDPWHAPDGMDAMFSEAVIRLPNSRFCYQPVPFAPEVSPPPYEKNGFITFGSFNNTSKYNQKLFATWGGILNELPDSRLILKWWSFVDQEYCQNVWKCFAALGVDPKRVEMRRASFHRTLLEEYSDVDIALDPFPFSGGHTSCEALWMGLPVVTLPSERPVSRQTLCFVGNIGNREWMDEWVAKDPADYIRKAVSLAGNPKRLRHIRYDLRRSMSASPLMDMSSFTKAMEAALIGLHGLTSKNRNINY